MKGMCYVVCYFIALMDISKLSLPSRTISLDVFNEGNVYIIFKCLFNVQCLLDLYLLI